MSISVLAEDIAETVTDAKDLAKLVPGVQISNGGSTLQTYVRGIKLERVEAKLGRSPNGIEPRPQRCCAEGRQEIEGSIAPAWRMERVKGIEPSS